MASFDLFLPLLLKVEGGYVDDPEDPGGETNKGITMSVFQHCAHEILGIDPTSENLKGLTDAQAGVSRPGESHPEALAELHVRLSTHTAPNMEPRRTLICQWANNPGTRRERRVSQCVARRRWRRSFLYFRLAQRARSRSSSRIVGESAEG